MLEKVNKYTQLKELLCHCEPNNGFSIISGFYQIELMHRMQQHKISKYYDLIQKELQGWRSMTNFQLTSRYLPSTHEARLHV